MCELHGDVGRVRPLVLCLLLASACKDGTGTGEQRQLEAVTAIEESTVVGSYVLPAPTVRLTTAAGAPLSGVPVSFRIEAGWLNPAGERTVSIRTDADGQASPVWWGVGSIQGTEELVASVPGAESVTFRATTRRDSITQFEITFPDSQDVVAGAGGAFTPVIRLRDRHGNPAAMESVRFRLVEGSGTLDQNGAIVQTSASGEVAMPAWRPGTTVGREVVAFEMPNSSLSRQWVVRVRQAAPAVITAVGGHNQVVVAGQLAQHSGDFVMRDRFGNPVDGYGVGFMPRQPGMELEWRADGTDASGFASTGWIR